MYTVKESGKDIPCILQINYLFLTIAVHPTLDRGRRNIPCESSSEAFSYALVAGWSILYFLGRG
ncbi:hypothetical protein FQP34_00610 [Peribacillus simplex]|uniref:Uncharacterized protein n=1 Tax=Peribacillus simplex TaxID=1478 RepID=A0A8B5Y450_9BACI|nr:hypothetical protein [Peribacillus simplex]TVX83781.1 hypothetical protein FQP34_00610 [Peribacillus simplex]